MVHLPRPCFQENKATAVIVDVLAHYDPRKELVLTCDVSPCGIRAVLAHRWPNGEERQISYASRTLAIAERKYAHIVKEGLAVIFGVKKFK